MVTKNFLVIILMMTFAFVIGPAFAVKIISSPDIIYPGDVISLSIDELKDNSSFSLLIEGDLKVTPGSDFAFETADFKMPFTLYNGSIITELENTESNKIDVKKGDTEAIKSGNSINGKYTSKNSVNLESGIYDFIRMGGKALPDKDTVITRLQITGDKKGPDSSQISFQLNGLTSGKVVITAIVDGLQVYYKTILIADSSSEIATYYATTGIPEQTEIQNNNNNIQTGSTNDYTTISVKPSNSEAIIKSIANTKDLQNKSFTSSTIGELRSVRSLDGLVTIIANSEDYFSLLPIKPESLPTNWNLLNSAYAVIPEGRVFEPPGKLSFKLPDEFANGSRKDPVFIAKYESGSWVAQRSKVDQGNVEVSCDKGGDYALISISGTSTIPEGIIETGTTTPVKGSIPPMVPLFAVFIASITMVQVLKYRIRR